MQTHFDIIVLGVGSMGSATCYYLSRQGASVLGLEQFDIPHELGSHAGQSRIIRKAYYEHPDYVPLLERAYQNWKDLELVTNAQVYVPTGLLYLGKPQHPIIKGVHESANQYNIRLDQVSNAEMKTSYPQVSVPEDYEMLFEPEAGFITPERAILLYTNLAIQQGATIKTKVKVNGWTYKNNQVEVSTNAGIFTANKIIITAGAWAPKLIPPLTDQLTITRQMLAWVIPRKPKLFELGTLPCWIIAEESQPGIFYGFPMLPVDKFNGPIGFKIAHHTAGITTDPDTISRLPTQSDEAILVDVLNRYFPDGYQSTHVMKTCMYTNSPDENFILDFLPGYEQHVIVATGFSGHGFKFASVIGEIMCDLAIKGATELPIDFLKLDRQYR